MLSLADLARKYVGRVMYARLAKVPDLRKRKGEPGVLVKARVSDVSLWHNNPVAMVIPLFGHGQTRIPVSQLVPIEDVDGLAGLDRRGHPILNKLLIGDYDAESELAATRERDASQGPAVTDIASRPWTQAPA